MNSFLGFKDLLPLSKETQKTYWLWEAKLHKSEAKFLWKRIPGPVKEEVPELGKIAVIRIFYFKMIV